MLWVPQMGLQRIAHNTGTVGSDTVGTSVTTAGSASSKGAPAELIASTPFDSYWIDVLASNYAAAATLSECALDILVGPATERILIPNLLAGQSGSKGPRLWSFPLYIPAGTRIAAQAAGTRVSTSIAVAVFLYGGAGMPPHRVGTKVTTYGMGTLPIGTVIAPGASGAEGSWAQLTGASSEDHFYLLPSFQGNGDITMFGRNIQIDLGIGAATEQELGSWWFVGTLDEEMRGPYPSRGVFHPVPSGSRLVMRASNEGTNDAGGYTGVVHAVS
jgi:hypothetical protein